MKINIPAAFALAFLILVVGLIVASVVWFKLTHPGM